MLIQADLFHENVIDRVTTRVTNVFRLFAPYIVSL